MPSPQDRWDISDLLSRYCFAADTRSLAALDEVFTEDVECVFQTGSRTGRDNVREFMGGILASLTATQHNLTSSVVTESAGGDGPRNWRGRIMTAGLPLRQLPTSSRRQMRQPAPARRNRSWYVPPMA